MVQLPYLQPFDDVNKRVSRLAANIPFIKSNLLERIFDGSSRCQYLLLSPLSFTICGKKVWRKIDLRFTSTTPVLKRIEVAVVSIRDRHARYRQVIRRGGDYAPAGS